MMQRFWLSSFVLLLSGPVHAQDLGVEFFEKKIRPVLVEHCYRCHSAEAKKSKGGLTVDSRDGLRKGGESGPAVVPGYPDKSLLIQAVRFAGDELKMPPNGKLPAAMIADLEAWVKMGAPDPRDKVKTTATAMAWTEVVKKRRQWWSLQPVVKPAVPTPRNGGWSSAAIDRFLLARLETKGLSPAKPADPGTLLRRLSLVLTGLPPTAEQVEAFVNACALNPSPGGRREKLPAGVVAKAVDDFLASPHFGEHWARHWMDVVRFTETHGNEWNYEVHHAWRYRDYLIRAFNSDVPYDQLVREHIAGDLLASPRWNTKEQFNESVIGTAFYRFGEVNHDDCITLRQIGYDLIDNQIDTLSKAFQGLTIACARCHDHKIDAVSMQDYYGLLGILRSSRCVSHTIDGPQVNADIQRRMKVTKAKIRQEMGSGWLADAGRMERYLLAAAGNGQHGLDAAQLDAAPLKKWQASLGGKDLPLENPLRAWQMMMRAVNKNGDFALAWRKMAESLQEEARGRDEFNRKNFETLADFRQQSWPGWQVGGQGLRGKPSGPGDFVLAHDKDRVLDSILPAGAFTHVLSDKFNGTLRSPVLTRPGKRISFQVLGQNSAAVRLVSNSCQLNYANYRALIKNELSWITFTIPEDVDSLRTYAELMTMFDNPKFPDQLGTLGGDKVNLRVPWEKAAANPRSFFGVTQVVLHDQPSSPKAELLYVPRLISGPAPKSIAELAERYGRRIREAIQAWQDDRASDDDVVWLQTLLQAGLLSNAPTPQLAGLLNEYRKLDEAIALPRVVPGVADFGPGFDQAVFVRGDCLKPGEKAARGFVEVLESAPLVTKGSGRLELAEELAMPTNPLTARVMVNRIWHHLFGTGLVKTVDDFGHVGEQPSHPELLDYLAARFVEEGWSIKKLIRAIVLTRTFQTAHEPGALALEADPQNRLLQHYPARRMQAESIRDAILFASGRLDGTLYGMSIPSFREKDNEYRRLFKGPLDGDGRRSIYIKVTLMEAPKFLEVFNFPGGKVTQGRRDVTNVPAQALALLNDPFVHGQAEYWGKRLVEGKEATVAERVDRMFRRALGRPASAKEQARFAAFVAEVAALHKVGEDHVLASVPVWRDVAHTMFNVQEFISIP